MSSEDLLKTDRLSVYYGSVQALDQISIKVNSGTLVALLGANGAGKSTLMMTLIGATKSRSGTVHYRSKNLAGLRSHEIIQLGVGYSPEGRQIFPDLSVHENLVLGSYSKKITKKESADRMEEVFFIFPVLKERLQQAAVTLSGGEQQMLAIGRALMTRPELLLLDEPSLGIAPILTQKIFQVLVELKKKGTAILLAEQNAAMALEIADYGYVLELGRIVYEGAASKLLAEDGVRKAYLGV